MMLGRFKFVNKKKVKCGFTSHDFVLPQYIFPTRIYVQCLQIIIMVNTKDELWIFRILNFNFERVLETDRDLVQKGL